MAYYGYILRLLNAPVKRYYFGVCGEANPLEAGSQLIQAVREKKGWVPSELCRLFSLENLSDTIAYRVEGVALDSEEEVEDWIAENIRRAFKSAMKKPTAHEQATKLNECVNIDHVLRRIRRLRSVVTFNAGVYYEHNDTWITDQQWDAKAYLLVKLQKDFAYLLPYVGFFDHEFKDFDGSTGMHLPYNDGYFRDVYYRLQEYRQTLK